MGQLIALPAGLHASLRQIAEETGFDRDTVRKRIAEHGVAPSGKRGGHPVYRLRDVLPTLYVSGTDGEADPDKLDPFRRKAHYQAEHEKLQLAERRRELVPRIEVEEEQARIFKIVTQGFDTLPDVLERDCAAPAALLSRVEQALDGVREHMYAELTEHRRGETVLEDEGDAVSAAGSSV